MAGGLLVGVFFWALQVDIPLGAGRFTVYHNELLLGLMLAVAAGKAGRPELKAWLVAALPLLLIVSLHALVPGPAWDGLKAGLRVAEFVAALALPLLLIRSRAELSQALGLAELAVCFTSLWAILQSAAGPGAWINLGRESEVFGAFQAGAGGMGHHNQMAAFLIAALCLATASVMLGLHSGLSKASLALGLAALVCSYSRGAWAAALLALVPLAMALSPLARRRLLMGLLAGLLLVAFGPFHALHERLSKILADSNRIVYWSSAWSLWDGHSLWGWGVSGLDAEIKRIVAGLPFTEAGRHAFSFHLHNYYLQSGLSFGWPVWLAWAWLLWLPSSRARLAFASKDQQKVAVALALFAALLAFGVQSFTDVLFIHARGMQVALCWGLLLAMLNVGVDDAR